MLSFFNEWTFEVDHIPDDGRLPGRATKRWRDDSGPLKIARLEPASEGAYRFQSGDDIAVDVYRGRRIVATIGPSVSSANLDHFLADQILPRVISDQGQLVVHAGAIRVRDAAILLMGASGRGKSTLSASFARSGLALMGDDAMVVSWDTDRPLAKPVYPSLRLLPDSIDALFDERPETSDIASYTPKQRIELPLGKREPVEPVPIKALFHIGAPASDDVVAMRPMHDRMFNEPTGI